MQAATEKKKSNKKRFSILLVEDEEELRENYKEFLYQKGYNIVAAKDGSEAFFKYQNQHFDIVVTDLAMPKASGLDLVRSIRSLLNHTDKVKKNRALTPILVVSGNITDYKAEILVYQNINLIEKPISGTDLAKQIANTLSDTKVQNVRLDIDKMMAIINERILSISKDIISIIFKKGSVGVQNNFNKENFSINSQVYFCSRVIVNAKHSGFLIFNFKDDFPFKICNILKTSDYPAKSSFSLNDSALNTIYKISRGFAEKIIQAAKANKVAITITNSVVGGDFNSDNHLYFHGNFSGTLTKIKTDIDEMEVYYIVSI